MMWLDLGYLGCQSFFFPVPTVQPHKSLPLSVIYHETDIRYPGESSALCVVFVGYFSLVGLILLQGLRGLEMLEALTM